jgi:L-alanine-DL-glutamate epimerase-like enolase superfamily enzyme
MGYFHMPDRPGLGVELDDSALKGFPYIEGPQYVPHVAD